MRLFLIVCAVVLALAVPEQAHAQGANNGLTWTGVALLGGGATLSILASTAAKSTNCGAFVGSGFAVGCVEETNRGLLVAGLAAASLGGSLIAIGVNRQVVMGPRYLGFRWKF